MTRILTIIALLFATPAWAGSMDGKSFICNHKGIYQIALKFEDGQASYASMLNGQSNEPRFFAEKTSNYVEDDASISFGPNKPLKIFYWKLIKGTLDLQIIDVESDVVLMTRTCKAAQY